MAIYWTYAPAPQTFWITANTPLAEIPTPRTLLTEQEWKDALSLQNTGYELINGPSNKPIGQLPVPTLLARRSAMIVDRVYFHDACRATAYGGSNVYDTLMARMSSLTTLEQTRYEDITVFKRNMTSLLTYLQDVGGGVNLTDTQIDTLFDDAIVLMNAGG